MSSHSLLDDDTHGYLALRAKVRVFIDRVVVTFGRNPGLRAE